jgi:hypothetical protein
MLLNAGQTGTLDVTYLAASAAEVVDSSHMIYRLDVDPQDLVVPETLQVHVVWPSGYHATEKLPTGWTATSDGATYKGTVYDRGSWAIPLSKG